MRIFFPLLRLSQLGVNPAMPSLMWKTILMLRSVPVWVHNISDTHFSGFSTKVDNIHWESSNQGLDEVLYGYKHIPIPSAAT